jgi:hypothetical protein
MFKGLGWGWGEKGLCPSWLDQAGSGKFLFVLEDILWAQEFCWEGRSLQTLLTPGNIFAFQAGLKLVSWGSNCWRGLESKFVGLPLPCPTAAGSCQEDQRRGSLPPPRLRTFPGQKMEQEESRVLLAPHLSCEPERLRWVSWSPLPRRPDGARAGHLAGKLGDAASYLKKSFLQ